MTDLIVHRNQSVNLKFLLSLLGFSSFWGKVSGDFDTISVMKDGREKLLGLVQKEVQNSGFIPYHYLLTPEKKGKAVNGETVKFIGQLTQEVDCFNISGKFKLYLFEAEGVNYVWKSYSDKLLPPDTYEVSGRIVCKLVGRNKEIFMLVNYVRTKKWELVSQ